MKFSMDAASPHQDFHAFHARIAELERQLAEREAQIADKDGVIQELTEKVELLKAWYFAKRSEQQAKPVREETQYRLFDEAEFAAEEEPEQEPATVQVPAHSASFRADKPNFGCTSPLRMRQEHGLFDVDGHGEQMEFALDFVLSDVSRPHEAIISFQRSESTFQKLTHAADQAISGAFKFRQRPASCGLVHRAVLEITLAKRLPIGETRIAFVGEHIRAWRHRSRIQQALELADARLVCGMTCPPSRNPSRLSVATWILYPKWARHPLRSHAAASATPMTKRIGRSIRLEPFVQNSTSFVAFYLFTKVKYAYLFIFTHFFFV
jgi:hypothetical protein